LVILNPMSFQMKASAAVLSILCISFNPSKSSQVTTRALSHKGINEPGESSSSFQSSDHTLGTDQRSDPA